MKFDEYISLPANDRLQYFLETLSMTNRTPEYFVNWNKVTKNTKEFELELNTLNYLIGKQNIYDEALNLFTKQPELLRAVPSLIAVRDNLLDVLDIDDSDSMNFYKLSFGLVDTKNIVSYVDFMESTGLLNFLANDANKSLVDYVYGVEAGLDSNGRKNRSGTTMEGILERKVAKISELLGLEHYAQATPDYIFNHWNITVPVDKSARRFDEAVFDPKTNRLWLIETNYYGGGGSKLKAVSGEFTTLNKFINTAEDDVTFVWVSDGQGWHTASRPLGEAFESITNVFNLKMLSDDYLLELFK